MNNIDNKVGDILSGTNLVRAGDYNQRVVLQAIRSKPFITRIEIASQTNLTSPAIANITNRLLADGFILRNGKVLGERGQPAHKFVINPNGAYSIGISIDRDHTTFIAMDFAGEILYRNCLEEHFASPETVIDFILKEYNSIVSKRTINPKKLLGIGFAIPDDLDKVKFTKKPDYCLQWSQIDIASEISKRLDVNTIVENDATAAAIGELQFGAGIHINNSVYGLMNAGFGLGIIINGQAFRGSNGRAGEIGFIPSNYEASDKTSIQDNVSLFGLYDFMANKGFNIEKPSDFENLPTEAHELLDEWVNCAVESLKTSFLIINSLLNPQVFFLGGRLPIFVVKKVCAGLNQYLNSMRERLPKIAPVLVANLAEDAATIGAAIVMIQSELLPTSESLMKSSYA